MQAGLTVKRPALKIAVNKIELMVAMAVEVIATIKTSLSLYTPNGLARILI